MVVPSGSRRWGAGSLWTVMPRKEVGQEGLRDNRACAARRVEKRERLEGAMDAKGDAARRDRRVPKGARDAPDYAAAVNGAAEREGTRVAQDVGVEAAVQLCTQAETSGRRA